MSREVVSYPLPDSQTAFRLEYDRNTQDGEIWDDVVSYLGEYRFQIPEYSYELQFSHGEDGLRVRDAHRGESMTAKACRAYDQRESQRLNSSREKAELEGIVLLEKQVSHAKTGDKIIWASPPGNPRDGYGEYGFLYYGEVEKKETGEADMKMTALRIEGGDINRYNALFENIISDHAHVLDPEDFISRPVIVTDMLKEELKHEIATIFEGQDGKRQDELFSKAISHVGPMIRDFIGIAKSATRYEKEKAFHALENYTLEVKQRLEMGLSLLPLSNEQFLLDQIMDDYGFIPPQVKGSCGFSGQLSSPNFMAFGMASLVGEDEYGSLQFECPHCGSLNTRPRGMLIPSCTRCFQDVQCKIS